MWFYTLCPYGTAKIFVYRLLKITPQTPSLLFLFLNYFLTSFVRFDVFSVTPPPSQDELCAWCRNTVVLLWQTIISKTRTVRAALHNNIPLTLNQSTLPITH